MANWLEIQLNFNGSNTFGTMKSCSSQGQGWMDDLRFYVLFNSISVISGQWEVDNERMYAMELR